MAKLYNLARMTTATTGTGTITLNAAVTGFLSFASAGISDGDTVTYAIKDGSNSEIGRGVYTASGTTLTRSVLKSTNSNNAINLSGSAEVMLTAAAEDFLGSRVVVQKFTSSGTYTPTAGMTYCIIECVGGGGGGGGAAGTAGNCFTGDGGGAGSYSFKVSDASTVGASQTVTIGAGGAGGTAAANGSNGGDTSVGTLCIGKGGTGGSFTNVATFHTAGQGAGGVAGTGDVALAGMPGSAGAYVGATTTLPPGGNGGSTRFGGGGLGGYGAGAGNGSAAATNSGGGGGGAYAINTSSTGNGGAGAAGIVVITEFVR